MTVTAEGKRVQVKKDATLEEKRFRGATGITGRQMPPHNYIWVRLERMVDGYGTILVHPESLEEIN